MKIFSTTVLLAALTMSTAAFAADKPELRIGSVVAMTGPASALGLPEKNGLDLLEEQIAADASLPFKIKFVTYDDASDPTKAVNAVRKLITEDKVHVVICCTTTPTSMAILETIAQAQVPNISLALAASVIEPVQDRKWVFKTPSTDQLQVTALVDDMVQRGIKKVGFLGLEDSFGEGGWQALQAVAKAKGVEIVAAERFARTDTNFTPQALKVRQANPGAIYIHAIPPSSALVHQAVKRVGFTGPIYQSGGSANATFISVGKKDVEGSLVGTTPVLIYKDMSDSNPLKPVIAKFAALYEKKFNVEKVDIFPGQSWDAGNIAIKAAADAVTEGARLDDLDASRAAIRDKIEATRNFVAVGGIFDYSPTDHLGLDKRSTFISVVKDGQFRLYDAK
ncbi:ABC transporter substrate-binding protein [Bradyrhizobium sp. U87765 SZCCT0131]|uniref:ABC transporter substrate-binding protein n=1 Tax=unclassified Bradyrhizobium TaxID=2631580 RepID=UPI001BA563F4|nr:MULTISPECIES: ABC transporter substrate-binding protein [unclassified Bradyrhizobium]MBR1217526.1 ABC transporter substrate-binding protein [Bradyrhizobium sp. U87765 SZCCT0131]MBR1264876.1 ABC transporter substrate-binding protein [Bradyrhizobium sp. U87765 SZCCT0134]MBR1304858.1 ABC transporter substrate-binding protein [Bradyrhizobium sp. U87765 SZCCT0110]MBR1320645.1 ABC transporter substrate-binding protein [Bradyrhizobium sp. U87765 SZCCT0109]MBR1349065.1 ABC transporter substrate-bin